MNQLIERVGLSSTIKDKTNIVIPEQQLPAGTLKPFEVHPSVIKRRRGTEHPESHQQHLLSLMSSNGDQEDTHDRSKLDQ